MNVDTLIPGDIVYAKIENSYDGDYTEIPVVIERVFDNTVRCRAYKDQKTIYHVIPRSLISPIPLTKKILKANGFIEDEGVFKYEDEDIGLAIFIKPYEEYPSMTVIEGYGTINDYKFYLPNPTSVDRLQNSYRFCGFERLADNIKL